MVNILCSYVQIDSYPLVKIGSLFDGIAGQRTVTSIESIKCKSNGMSLRDKFRLLERINHMKQAIYSELIYTLRFGETGEKIAFVVRIFICNNQLALSTMPSCHSKIYDWRENNFDVD